MKLTNILPVIKNKVHHFISTPAQMTKSISSVSAPMPKAEPCKPMITSSYEDFKPIILSDKAKEALDTINSIRNKKLQDELFALGEFIPEPYTMRVAMKNGDTVEISRQAEMNPNLDFVFFNKQGQEREQIKVATQSAIYNEIPVALSSVKGQVHGYSTTRNNVMRPTDPMNRDPEREMTFEETVRTRPVILKHINSLLEKLGDELSH
ncbi:MAG: hypothetical protein NC390_05080 [Fusobacterium sp.]|nr:hypothetical protein [Fusobacterium sp.]